MLPTLRRIGACGVLGVSMLIGGLTGCQSTDHTAQPLHSAGPDAEFSADGSCQACPSATPCHGTTHCTAAPCSNGSCQGCQSGGACQSGGHCESCSPPRRWSEEWYQSYAHMPIGARQKEKHGKLWPPYPRPVGEQVPCSHRFHAAHYWPWPYNCQDRESIYQITQAHIDNGWVEECTLYHYHFDEESQVLNHAGSRQLRLILESAPEPHRVLWVQNGNTQDISMARTNAVRVAATQMFGGENIPPIMIRVGEPASTPANQVDAQTRGFLKTLPEPRINYQALPQGT